MSDSRRPPWRHGQVPSVPSMRPRASSDDGGREQAVWRAAKLVGLFLLSFCVAFRFWTGLGGSTGGPVVRQRSLREDGGTDTGSVSLQHLSAWDHATSSSDAASARSGRCRGIFGGCKSARGHLHIGSGAGGSALPAVAEHRQKPCVDHLSSSYRRPACRIAASQPLPGWLDGCNASSGVQDVARRVVTSSWVAHQQCPSRYRLEYC